MPVMGRTKDEVLKEFRTAEILEAARKIFAAHGYHEATVEAVAGEAGVAKGTIYLYYGSKRELYGAALKHGILELYDETKRRVGKAVTLEEKIRAFIATKIIYFDERRDFFKIYYFEFGDALVHPARLNEQFARLYVQQARMLETILREAAERQEIRPIRTAAAAFGIADLTRGTITQRLLGWSTAPVEDDIEFVFDLVWRGIKKN
jgi:AcrR family transcriptional regulator